MKPFPLWPAGSPHNNNGEPLLPRLELWLTATNAPKQHAAIIAGHGFVSFVLHCRVAPCCHPLPMSDACRAVRMVRHMAADRTRRCSCSTPLTLTPVEFDLLASLARAAGRVKTRDVLLEEIRDRNHDVLDRSIDVHICGLRKKLGDDPKEPRFIRTVRAAGYMLINPEAEP